MSVEPLTVDYFDGRRPQPQRVRLHIVRDRIRLLDPEAGGSGPEATLLELPLAAVEWPARTRHGARIARIAGGGELHAIDVGLWDAWAASHGLRRPLVVRVRLRWRIVLAVLLFLALLAYGAWRWGLPLHGRTEVAAAPEAAPAPGTAARRL
jgi:hypothetical protein